MSERSTIASRLAGAAFLVLVAPSLAFAQEAGVLTAGGSNEVWLGQLGDENVLVIEQRGERNRVGDNRDALLLQQDGTGNSLEVEQIGIGNRVGLDRDLPLTGFQQRGGGNGVAVRQLGSPTQGRNVLGALLQRSNRQASESNGFSLAQRGETAGEAGSDNVVGTVRQVKSLPGASNGAVIVQGGDGNLLSRVRQQGSANRIGSTQIGASHAIRRISQTGTDNELDLVSDAGNGNIVGTVLQRGRTNRTVASVSGSRNRVDRIEQDNSGLSGTGNAVSLSISGDDNGTAGFAGAPATFSSIADPLRSPLDAVSAAQGELAQFGIGNSFALTIVGSANLYGAFQDGDGNVLTALQTGRLNQIASTQIGDGNTLDVVQTTDPLSDPLEEIRGNAAQAYFEGERNRATVVQEGVGNEVASRARGADNVLDVDQTGLANRVDIDVTGSLNNADGARLAPRTLSGGALRAGRFEQRGTGNDILGIVIGDANAQSVRQSGDLNSITFVVTGDGNEILIDQNGSGNIVSARQTGIGNVATFQQ